MKNNWYVVLGGIIVIMLVGLLSFGITGCIIWLICKCFSLDFSWRMAFGIWLIMGLASSVFKTTVEK